MIRHADWIVDVGPAAGEHGGEVLYSGPPEGLAQVKTSRTREYLFRSAPSLRPGAAQAEGMAAAVGSHAQQPGQPRRRVSARRVHDGHRCFRLRQIQPRQSVARGARGRAPGPRRLRHDQEDDDDGADSNANRRAGPVGRITGGMERDQASGAGRPATDRPNAALEPRHLHGPVRSRPQAVRRDEGGARPALRRRALFLQRCRRARCETCQGEGFVMVELLFLPSVYAPCPTCHGARYNAKTLEIQYRGKNIAEVLAADGGRRVDVLRGRAARAPRARRPAPGRRRLPAARSAGHGAFRRRGAADQARDRTAARATRPDALRPRRAHHRAPSLGRREAADATRWTRRRRQHRHRRRARHERGRRRATGSSTSALAPATKAAASSPKDRPGMLRPRRRA